MTFPEGYEITLRDGDDEETTVVATPVPVGKPYVYKNREWLVTGLVFYP
jgi:hypothetical protein